MTAINPRENLDFTSTPDPHPCCLDHKEIPKSSHDDDYETIVNCCQRHTCRADGYCKSAKGGCRFGFPIEKTALTHIEFVELNGQVKANILIKRNDPWMNSHNRLTAHNWRGNVDMQIILDQQAAINYMVKYVTKGIILFKKYIE